MTGHLRSRRPWRSPAFGITALALLTALAGGTAGGLRDPASGLPPPTTASVDPAALVHPLDGTATGPVNPGTVGEFPGADLPFGMLQWSPDTRPNAAQSGGGYAYEDSAISGFSLTHLSGTGCPSYQDVPILPTVGVLSSPTSTVAPFSHEHEQATPGRYQVQLGGPAPISVSLAVTTRTGISSFVFPPSTESNVLFKVADSSNPVSASNVRLIGDDEVEGQVSSGQFCGTGTDYRLSFAARFNRPFSSGGTWDASGITAGSSACTATTCGAFATFNTTTERRVLMKVAISFVSTQDAMRNLETEDPGWSLPKVAAIAAARWNALLGRVSVEGGTSAQEHMFYTALYHSLLFPNVVSDVNGQYAGSDGKVHTAKGREEYANFSEWDIYRSEVQLESLVDPHDVGNMVQSLVNDAQQAGWLPKWAIVGGDESQMNGDSADPIIADAYAMGVRNFNVRSALRYMVKGATETEDHNGLEIERQYLSQYVSQHYVNANSPDLTSIDYSIGGSATLEYAIDDFAIAQIASAEHDRSLASTMDRRAANWEYLFNPATGYVQARGADGTFPAGSAFEASQLEPGGQTGFEEGNAVQYTWSVPQDLAGLATLMGGGAVATGKLQAFMRSLNATRSAPQEWSGNEPDEWAPWEFDFFGSPDQTQRFVRAIADSEYADAPVDEPGNDDLGALSSWYVWATLGLFPVTPGSANLALASPLFPSVRITLPDGRRLVEVAPGAAASRPYVHALTVNGVTRPIPGPARCGRSTTPRPSTGNWGLAYLPGSALTSGGSLHFTLSGTPDPNWASSPEAAPPSFAAAQLPALGYSMPSGTATVTAGQTTTIRLGVATANGRSTTVRWRAAPGPGGLMVSPSSGSLTVGRPRDPARHLSQCGASTLPATTLLNVAAPASASGSSTIRIMLRTANGVALPPVVVDVVTSH